MTKIATLTTGANVTTEVELSYVPEFIYYTAATQLVNVTIKVLGVGVVTQLDANGLNTVGRFNQVGQIADGTIIRLGDGLHRNKKCTMIFENSGAQTPTVYGASTGTGSLFVESIAQSLNQNTPAYLSRLLMAAFPSASGSDNLTVEYSDGTVEQLDFIELSYLTSLQQSVQNSANDYQINNSTQAYRKVTFYPVSGAQTIYTSSIVGNKIV